MTARDCTQQKSSVASCCTIECIRDTFIELHGDGDHVCMDEFQRQLRLAQCQPTLVDTSSNTLILFGLKHGLALAVAHNGSATIDSSLLLRAAEEKGLDNHEQRSRLACLGESWLSALACCVGLLSCAQVWLIGSAESEQQRT